MASSPTSTGPAATSLVSASCRWNLRRSSLGSCVSCCREPRALPCSSIPNSQVRAAASAMGQQIDVLYVSSDREIETAFATLAQRGAGALHVGVGTFMFSQRERIVALAARHRIPLIAPYRDFAAVGGLMSYGASIPDAYRQAAIYAGRILKGEKPGDLPVMLPTKFELVINLKTANELGLIMPPGVLAIADEVIE